MCATSCRPRIHLFRYELLNLRPTNPKSTQTARMNFNPIVADNVNNDPRLVTHVDGAVSPGSHCQQLEWSNGVRSRCSAVQGGWWVRWQRTHVYVYIYIYIYEYTHTCNYMCVYVYIYIYIYLCVCSHVPNINCSRTLSCTQFTEGGGMYPCIHNAFLRRHYLLSHACPCVFLRLPRKYSVRRD